MCKLESILQFGPHKTGPWHLLCSSVVLICFQIKHFKLGYLLSVTSVFKIFLLFFILGIL